MSVTDECHHFEVLPNEKLKIAEETTCLVLWENAANREVSELSDTSNMPFLWEHT